MSVTTAPESALGARQPDRRRPARTSATSTAGPADGPAVVLLHGWPYDIHSYAEVVPLLAAAGYRVIVPYLRGYGTTRFLSDETVRNGEQAALALDAVALMDALGIETAVVAGFDWGARTRRHRRRALAGPLQRPRLGERLPDRQPGSRQAAVAAGGRAAVVVPVLLRHRARPRRLREIPARVREADLANRVPEVGLRRRHLRAQRSVIRQPRPRRDRDPQLPLAARTGRRRSRSTPSSKQRLAEGPVITVPAITLEGDANGAPHPGTGRLRREVRRPVLAPDDRGRHRAQPPQEAPEAFADAVLELDRVR